MAKIVIVYLCFASIIATTFAVTYDQLRQSAPGGSTRRGGSRLTIATENGPLRRHLVGTAASSTAIRRIRELSSSESTIATLRCE